MTDRSHDLNRTSLGTLHEQRFYDLALDRQFSRSASGFVEGDQVTPIEKFLRPYSLARALTDYGVRTWLATKDKLVVQVTLYPSGEWQVMVAGDKSEGVDAAVEGFAKVMPPAVRTDDSLSVQFWAMGPLGPISYRRRLDAAAWPSVEANYPRENREALGRLMAMTGPPDTGRLVLWHGPPGTGKTHAIRALASAWQSWCDVDYVVDADEFFTHAHYMVGTMVMNEDDMSDRWRLVIIEDAGEFLTADAHAKTGQGLSRLLNLTDGLVGQGLRLLTLMTTNEPADELHPAVTRPGRCLANHRFGPFEADEARGWLEDRGVAGDVDEPASLAELYALVGPLREERQERAARTLAALRSA